jgi:hypothetical protein
MTTRSRTPRDDLSWPILGVFLLALVGGFLALEGVPNLRARLFYVEGRCVLLDKRLIEHPPSGKAINSTYRPEFLIGYTVAGREYKTWAYKAVKASSGLRWPEEHVLESFTVGQEYPCWYDPDDPSKVVVVRGYSWFTWVLLVVFLVVLFFTGRGFLRHLRSARRPAGDASGAESGQARPSRCT